MWDLRAGIGEFGGGSGAGECPSRPCFMAGGGGGAPDVRERMVGRGRSHAATIAKPSQINGPATTAPTMMPSTNAWYSTSVMPTRNRSTPERADALNAAACLVAAG